MTRAFGLLFVAASAIVMFTGLGANNPATRSLAYGPTPSPYNTVLHMLLIHTPSQGPAYTFTSPCVWQPSRTILTLHVVVADFVSNEYIWGAAITAMRTYSPPTSVAAFDDSYQTWTAEVPLPSLQPYRDVPMDIPFTFPATNQFVHGSPFGRTSTFIVSANPPFPKGQGSADTIAKIRVTIPPHFCAPNVHPSAIIVGPSPPHFATPAPSPTRRPFSPPPLPSPQ